VLETELDDFFDLFYLLGEAADHVIRAVGHFLDHHERDEGVDGGGEGLFELVGVGEEGDAFADCEFADVDAVGDVDDYNYSLTASWRRRQRFEAYRICLQDALSPGPSSCPSPLLPLRRRSRAAVADPAPLVVT